MRKYLLPLLVILAALSVALTTAGTAKACGRVCTTFITASANNVTVGTPVTLTGTTTFGAGYTGTFDVSYDNGATWTYSGLWGTTNSSGQVVVVVNSGSPQVTQWRFNAASHVSDPTGVTWS